MGTNISPDWYQILDEKVGGIQAAIIFVLGPDGIITVEGHGITTANAVDFAKVLRDQAMELKMLND